MGARGNRATILLTTLALALASGCYDSQWGQQKAAQARTAARATPATLRTEDSETPPPSTHNAAAKTQKLRVRALVTRSFTAQIVDTPRHLRELFEDLNRITERDLGVHLELTETKPWDLVDEDDLEKAHATLRAKEPGDDVDWVAGFIGSLPRTTRSFHELGKGTLVGKHVVARAPSSAERHDAIERSLSELSEDERHALEKNIRRHRATAIFLHELGHTLGSVHETSQASIMFPEYNAKMAAFGPSANDVMRASIAKHGASELVIDEEVVAALERAPSGAFVEAERVSLVGQLRMRIARASAPVRVAPAPSASASAAAAAPPAEGAIPDTPELTGVDRERFVEAFGAARRGDVKTAWTVGKPLFGTYPRSMSVQDLRCQVASRSMPFDVARKECALLMKLSTEVSR